MAKKVSTRELLDHKNQTLTGSKSLLGINSLSMPQYNNTMRTNMFSSHTRQYRVLRNPDVAHIITGGELLAGKYSSAYKRVKNDSEVYAVVKKFEYITDKPTVYTMFIYDRQEEKYKILTRKDVETLSENHSYEYINDVIDGYDVGDVIEKDTIVYRSTSYDEHGNYGYGMNALTMFTFDPYTHEDAAVVRRGFAEKMTSIKTDIVDVMINNNEVLCNLYGEDGEYTPLPGLGEKVSGILIAKRKIFDAQALNELTDEALNEINFLGGDECYFTSGEVVDIDIFCNNPELAEIDFNSDMIKYINAQKQYYTEIESTCREIRESGKDYSKEITYIHKRAKEFLDEESKWTPGDNIFDNVVIRLTVKRIEPLRIGQKITGRHGNKCVISDIRDDDVMPILETGEPVDLLINTCGVVNRTIAGVLKERGRTFVARRFLESIKATDNMKEKERLLFDFYAGISKRSYDTLRPIYLSLSKKEQKEYMDNVEMYGIIQQQNPLWEEEDSFYTIMEMTKKYPDIVKPYDVYIKKSNGWRKCMRKQHIGTMYLMKLKQDSSEGFSGRATGSINNRGLPEKSYKHKTFTNRVSSTPIRFGEFETLNFRIGMPMDELALVHALFRNSPKGRELLANAILDPTGEKEIPKYLDNRVAEILHVIFKSLGIEIVFKDERNELQDYSDDMDIYDINGAEIICDEHFKNSIEILTMFKEEILVENPVLDSDEFMTKLKEKVVNNKFPNKILELYDYVK